MARYSCETGESALLAPGRAPRSIVEQLNGWSGSAIAAPLTVHGRHFGSLVATRERPFDQRDLDGLVRLAFHAAPGLRSWQPMRSTSSAVAALRM